METGDFIFFMFVVFLNGLIVYFRIRYGVHYLPGPYRYGGNPFNLYHRKLEKIYHPFLPQYFPFYNALNAKNKLRFEKRVQKFIDMKRFVPRGGLKTVSSEIKVLIAGSAVQITFGYPGIYFRHFRTILVYPDNYYSTITRNYHKGEVHPRGLIVVSWRNLKEGFRDPNDGYHLGLHEMAHALRLINIVHNPEFNFYDQACMKLFDEEAKKEIHRIRHTVGGSQLYRSYSLTNVHEFFAVSVELFFECPYELQTENPALYSLLKKILKIDPIAVYEAGEIEGKAA